MPFYLLGRQVRAIYPFVPLSPQGHALSIGIVSYDGGVFFGLAGDRSAIADIDEVAADIEATLAEQLAASRLEDVLARMRHWGAWRDVGRRAR